MSDPYNKLQDYEPPSWANDLRCLPSAYVQVLTLTVVKLIVSRARSLPGFSFRQTSGPRDYEIDAADYST